MTTAILVAQPDQIPAEVRERWPDATVSVTGFRSAPRAWECPLCGVAANEHTWQVADGYIIVACSEVAL